MKPDWTNASRRQVLCAAGAAGAALMMGPSLAFATAESVNGEIAKLFPGKTPKDGKISLELPSIAENGLVVPVGFEVESPMTEQDYVKQVHFFAEGNPNPFVVAFSFTPMMPKAAGQFRIRLAKTQNVVAVAEMSNGDVYVARQEVKVTIGGCGG